MPIIVDRKEPEHENYRYLEQIARQDARISYLEEQLQASQEQMREKTRTIEEHAHEIGVLEERVRGLEKRQRRSCCSNCTQFLCNTTFTVLSIAAVASIGYVVYTRNSAQIQKVANDFFASCNQLGQTMKPVLADIETTLQGLVTRIKHRFSHPV